MLSLKIYFLFFLSGQSGLVLWEFYPDPLHCRRKWQVKKYLRVVNNLSSSRVSLLLRFELTDGYVLSLFAAGDLILHIFLCFFAFSKQAQLFLISRSAAHRT